MEFIMQDNLAELLNKKRQPCLSLYQPTHRHHPDNAQDPIRFKNLVKQLEGSLLTRYPPSEIGPLMEPFHVLAHDPEFWKHTPDGIAVFRTPDFFKVYGLQRTVSEIAVVADSFHIKPLKYYLQTVDRFQVLCLTRDAISLFEGNRHLLDPLDIVDEVPRTVTQALGEELTDKHITVASYNGPKHATPNMYHGHGSRKEEVANDQERFFRVVDRAVLNHYSKPSGLPLVLAALPEYHSLFHRISHNPMLVPEGVKIDATAIDQNALREKAWEVFEPYYHQKINRLVDDYQVAHARQLGSDDILTVSRAAAEGRVATLLLEENRVIPGKIINHEGDIVFQDLEHHTTDDLLDDIGEQVWKMGGKVMIVPPDAMPATTGLAAIFRY